MSAARRAKAEGQKPQAADFLIQAAAESEAAAAPLPRSAYVELCTLLYQAGRFDEALQWLGHAEKRAPKTFGLVNLRGVVLRRLGRYDEALAAFKEASKLDGKDLSPLVNSGNVYLDQHEGARAADVFSRLARRAPNSSEYQRLLGVAYRQSGDLERARRQFERARQLAPKDSSTWIQLAAVLDDAGDREAAFDTLDRALAHVGTTEPLVSARVTLLRRSGRFADAAVWLKDLIARNPDRAWLHLQLARTLVRSDRRGANENFARALALAPDNREILTEYADSLDRTRGPDEARNIGEAYELALRRIRLGGNLVRDARTLRNILVRCADYAAAQRLGNFEQLGAYWAKSGQETALHYMMGQVRTPEQRRHLVAWHRLWGRSVEKLAAQTPLRAAPAVTGRAKIRIGLMSSDLRNHPVAYFAAPLIAGYDRSRFEMICYSWNARETDPIQERLRQQADGFRLVPAISDRDAAQLIADDALDVLFELGGSTDMNKIRTMAWRPAPRQASWLGYPHSAGIEAIDRIVTDPFITPEDPALLIEQPLELAHSWVAFDRPGFGSTPDIDPATPEERHGVVTFGTMNNPYKYNPACIAAWAAVLRTLPDSRFLFVRPEGAVPAFRANIERLFADHGVDGERIGYVPVRGAHLPHYNRIDVALDTFPQTGGTTTCETLFMGVPVVTLIGEAFFERLSYSNLSNAGLGALCAGSVEDYVAKAVAVAQNTAWRRELRRTMRERLKSHPLGRPELFVHDFQDAVLRWMDEGRA